MKRRAGKTYEAVLRTWDQPPITVTLRRLLTLPGVAFTILDCAACSWRVYVEAHHAYGSGRRTSPSPGGRGRLGCPKCKCKEWHYVRTDVYHRGPRAGLFSQVGGRCR